MAQIKITKDNIKEIQSQLVYGKWYFVKQNIHSDFYPMQYENTADNLLKEWIYEFDSIDTSPIIYHESTPQEAKSIEEILTSNFIDINNFKEQNPLVYNCILKAMEEYANQFAALELSDSELEDKANEFIKELKLLDFTFPVDISAVRMGFIAGYKLKEEKSSNKE